MPNFPKLTRPRLILCLVLVAACAVFLFFNFDLRRRTPFWDKYQQVQYGMTEEQVEEILGPCDDPLNMSFSSVCGWVEGGQSSCVTFVGGPHGDVVSRKQFEPQPWGETLREGWLSFRDGWSSWLRWLETQLGL
jgi:hypothetical protein